MKSIIFGIYMFVRAFDGRAGLGASLDGWIRSYEDGLGGGNG